MTGLPPRVVAVGGACGVGKSTHGARLLRELFGIDDYILAPGRVPPALLWARVDAGSEFGFETTLSSQYWMSALGQFRGRGYAVHVSFLTVSSAAVAVERVARRVRDGGHSVPGDQVREWFGRAAWNFFFLDRHIAHGWMVYDTSRDGAPRIVATGAGSWLQRCVDGDAWEAIVLAGRQSQQDEGVSPQVSARVSGPDEAGSGSHPPGIAWCERAAPTWNHARRHAAIAMG